MFEKHERYDPSPDITYKVVEIIITSMIEHTTTTTQQQDIPMRSATQLMYNYIDEYKDFLQDTGTCVIDNFIGMYGRKEKNRWLLGKMFESGFPDASGREEG